MHRYTGRLYTLFVVVRHNHTQYFRILQIIFKIINCCWYIIDMLINYGAQTQLFLLFLRKFNQSGVGNNNINKEQKFYCYVF